MGKSIYTKDYKEIINRLKQARIDAGLSQQAVADKFNKPQSYVSKIESGERRRRGGASKFAVRIFVKKGSDFNQKAPPIFKIRILGDCCLAPPKAGLGLGKDFERIFEIQKQFLPAQTEVRFAEGKHKFKKFIN